MKDTFNAEVKIRTDVDSVYSSEGRETDRFRVIVREGKSSRSYRSVSYASVQRLIAKLRNTHLDIWLWR